MIKYSCNDVLHLNGFSSFLDYNPRCLLDTESKQTKWDWHLIHFLFVSAGSQNVFAKFLLCCLKCCFWCLEKFLKFINRNAYIMVCIFFPQNATVTWVTVIGVFDGHPVFPYFIIFFYFGAVLTPKKLQCRFSSLRAAGKSSCNRLGFCYNAIICQPCAFPFLNHSSLSGVSKPQ